jgi:hypothetical protein
MSTYSEDALNGLIARLGKVRRWLLALGVLRTATVWLVAILLYVDLYVVLDHRLHFGRPGRVAALAGLVTILAILVHLLIRTLRRDMSYTHAARYVEARHSFDQQLVAAVEFYEKGTDYPYSKRLARQLVLNVDDVCRDFAFDSMVNKQQGYILAGCIGSCLVLVSLFVYGNLQYFSKSLAGLVNPLTAVEPTPPAAPVQTPSAGPAPGIEEIIAAVRTGQTTEELTQKVTDFALEVLPGSQIELQVKATTPLQEATIDGIEGKPVVQKLDGAKEFRVPFKADKPLSLSFRLLSSEGVSSTAPLTMRVSLKPDTPPQFKLLSPEGDCLATNVASIPISFEVTDDFGLDQAQLYCQLPVGTIVVLDSNSPQGARQARLSVILELEQYELNVGDSILFYAKARDVVTSSRRGDPNTCSEIYLIEIRPYHQYWHPQPSGGPSQVPGASPEDLITVLEYTRAIVKKTWTLAQSPQKEPEEYEKLRSDTEYCAKRLATMRDDPDNRFTNDQKAALTRIISPYGNVASALTAKDAGKAVAPAQEAYRLLRKFVDELHMKWNPPDSGKSVPQETPERVKLQEQPKPSDQDQQRAENQLEKAQNQIDSLAQQEKALKADIAKATQKQNQQSGGQNGEGKGQKAESAKSPGAGQAQSSAKGQRGTQSGAGEKGSGDQQAQAGPESKQSQGDGKGQQGTRSSDGKQNGASQAKGQGKEPSQGKGNGQPSEGGAPSIDALLRMLGARQNALRQQASQLSADLAKLALPASSGQAGAKDAARQSLDQAVDSMKQLEDKLGEARYSPESSGKKEGDMAALAESATRELAQAGQAIGKALASGKQATDAEKAEAIARQLAKDAEAFDGSLSPQEKQEMLDRLKAAERLLERMDKPGTQTVWGSGGGSASQGYTRNASTSPGETAQMLSRQFWSVSIQTRNRQMRGTENEPSDAHFFESENKFFENAAKFKPQQSQK